jgi:hypothetical protein
MKVTASQHKNSSSSIEFFGGCLSMKIKWLAQVGRRAHALFKAGFVYGRSMGI